MRKSVLEETDSVVITASGSECYVEWKLETQYNIKMGLGIACLGHWILHFIMK